MNESVSESASAFWQFSLRFYARAKVASTCLTLQDRYGADVNLLFFLLFLSLQQRRLTPAEVQRIDRSTSAWRTRVVIPLRALRRDLKNGAASMDTQATDALRSEIKRCELHAERLQQEMLERAFPAATIGTASSVKDAATENLTDYRKMIGAPSDDLMQTLLELFAEEFSR